MDELAVLSNEQGSSVLTEEMIDAAMFQCLKRLEGDKNDLSSDKTMSLDSDDSTLDDIECDAESLSSNSETSFFYDKVKENNQLQKENSNFLNSNVNDRNSNRTVVINCYNNNNKKRTVNFENCDAVSEVVDGDYKLGKPVSLMPLSSLVVNKNLNKKINNNCIKVFKCTGKKLELINLSNSKETFIIDPDIGKSKRKSITLNEEIINDYADRNEIKSIDLQNHNNDDLIIPDDCNLYYNSERELNCDDSHIVPVGSSVSIHLNENIDKNAFIKFPITKQISKTQQNDNLDMIDDIQLNKINKDYSNGLHLSSLRLSKQKISDIPSKTVNPNTYSSFSILNSKQTSQSIDSSKNTTITTSQVSGNTGLCRKFEYNSKPGPLKQGTSNFERHNTSSQDNINNNLIISETTRNKMNEVTPEIKITTTKTANSDNNVDNESSKSYTSNIIKLTNKDLEKEILRSVKTQLFVPYLEPYRPDSNKYYTCLDCDDRFVLVSSLRNHKFRRSVLIKYDCNICNRKMNFYNKCMFLAHIRSHTGLKRNNLDYSSLVIEPLPTSLILFGQRKDVLDNTQSHKQTILAASSEDSRTNETIAPVSSSVSKVMPIKLPVRKVVTVPKLVPSDIHKSISQSIVTQKPDNVTVSSLDLVADSSSTLISSPNRNMDVINTSPKNNLNVVTTHLNENSDISIASSNERPDFRIESPKKNLDVPDTLLKENLVVDHCNSKENQTDLEVPADNIQPENCLKSDSVSNKLNCPECCGPINYKDNFKKHLQGSSLPEDINLICNVCRLILPTKCALKMHLRIHMRLSPFRCPDCGLEFSTYDMFSLHLNHECCHLMKCVRYVCSVCNQLQLSAFGLEQHLSNLHVRVVFKCKICPIAFMQVTALSKHYKLQHPKEVVNILTFRQCELCPGNLIPKGKFVNHIKDHIAKDKPCVYAYFCALCKNTFIRRIEFLCHKIQCEKDNNLLNGHFGSPQQTLNNISEISSECVNNDEEEITIPIKKMRMSNEEDPFHQVEDDEDPLSLEGFKIDEEPLKEPLVQKCVICKKNKVILVPGKNINSQSSCCKDCVRPFSSLDASNVSSSDTDKNYQKLKIAITKFYQCKLCKTFEIMNLKRTYEHFKEYHKNLEGQAIDKYLIIVNNLPNKNSKTKTASNRIKEKYKNVSENCEKDSNRQRDEQPISNEQSPIKMKQKQEEKINFEVGLVINSKVTESNLKCSKCHFIGEHKDDFRKHIIIHRDDRNSVQCPECGECFVVIPSLEKHLIIKHRIQNVDDFIEKNRKFIDDSYFFNGGNMNEIAQEILRCEVCDEVFESKPVLDKHFRSHGMAFLFKNL